MPKYDSSSFSSSYAEAFNQQQKEESKNFKIMAFENFRKESRWLVGILAFILIALGACLLVLSLEYGSGMTYWAVVGINIVFWLLSCNAWFRNEEYLQAYERNSKL